MKTLLLFVIACTGVLLSQPAQAVVCWWQDYYDGSQAVTRCYVCSDGYVGSCAPVGGGYGTNQASNAPGSKCGGAGLTSTRLPHIFDNLHSSHSECLS